MGHNYLDTAKKLLNIAEELKENEATQGEIATAYERAGDAYLLAGKSGTANEFYKTSKNYAHDDHIKDRLREKITGNYSLDKIKSNIQRLNVSSLEKEAGLGARVDDKKKKKLFEPGFFDRVFKPNTPFAILSAFSLMAALFFISVNLTGFASSTISINDSKWISFCLFACGLVFAFLFLNSKKRF